MLCPRCNQELADNQECQTCLPVTPPPDAEPGQQPNEPRAAPPPQNGPAREPAARLNKAKLDLMDSDLTAGRDLRITNVVAEHISVFEQVNKVQEESSLQESVKQLTARTARHYR